MFLEIISPERTLFNADVESVNLPGVNGSFEILNNHAAIVSVLSKGTIKILGQVVIPENTKDLFQKGEDSKTLLNIQGGAVEVKNNRVTVLVDLK